MNSLLMAGGVFDLGLLEGLVFAGVALSLVLSLLTLDFPDLSIEGTFPLGAALAAVILGVGAGWPAALAAAAGAGAVAGALTATLHVRLGMSKLLSGICTASMLYTLNIWVMGDRGNLPVLDEKTYFTHFEAIDAAVKRQYFTGRNVFLHPGSILGCALIVIALKVIVDFVLCSEFGVILRGVGHNESAARCHGKDPRRYKVAGLAMANAIAAISGALAAQYQGFSDVHMGVGVLVVALVAVILGQEIFARFDFSLASPKAFTRAALIGIVGYHLIFAAVLRAGIPPTTLRLFAGLSLIGVVALRKRQRKVSFSW